MTIKSAYSRTIKFQTLPSWHTDSRLTCPLALRLYPSVCWWIFQAEISLFPRTENLPYRHTHDQCQSRYLDQNQGLFQSWSFIEFYDISLWELHIQIPLSYWLSYDELKIRKIPAVAFELAHKRCRYMTKRNLWLSFREFYVSSEIASFDDRHRKAEIDWSGSWPISTHHGPHATADEVCKAPWFVEFANI